MSRLPGNHYSFKLQLEPVDELLRFLKFKHFHRHKDANVQCAVADSSLDVDSMLYQVSSSPHLQQYCRYGLYVPDTPRSRAG